jgi:AcrR family transcriptional regulator
VTPRPRNRRSQIVAAAGPLFHQMGYHQVGMAQIAAAVGITAGALYRHFPGKQQVLTAVIAEYFTRLQEVGEAQLRSGADLDTTVRRLAEVALDRREAPLLWMRESSRVGAEDRAHIQTRFRSVPDTIGRGLRRTRPELTPAGADILAWRAVAVLTSPSYHRNELPRPLFEDVLVDMAMAVLALEPPVISLDDIAAAHRPEGPVLPRLSRREALLSEALRLFAERGYHGVTVEEIGATVGITGPSVYHHFAGKAEFLRSLLTRGAEGMQLAMSQVLSTATDPVSALVELMRAYATFAWDHSMVMTVLVSEAHNLPRQDYRLTRQGQREYLAEWVHLLRLAVPGLDETHARIRVHAALTVVNHLARTKRARLIPPLRAHVVDCALATLGLPEDPRQATPWISEPGAIRSSPR